MQLTLTGIDALNYLGANARADGEAVKALIILTDGDDFDSSNTLTQYKAVRGSSRHASSQQRNPSSAFPMK